MQQLSRHEDLLSFKENVESILINQTFHWKTSIPTLLPSNSDPIFK